jgi:metal-dependent HD superfamily phosphatase/phosphodiesterase
MEIADKPLSEKMQGRIPYWHGSYEITKISQRAIAQVELYPFKRSKEV